MVTKTTISFPETVFSQLNDIAKVTGVCKADLIRIAVSDFIKEWGQNNAAE